MRALLVIVALAVAVWMAVLAHTTRAAPPGSHDHGQPQGACVNSLRHCGRGNQ